MPEPFKNAFNRLLIEGMAEHFQKQWPAFDAEAFTVAAAHQLDTLELKARSEQIMQAMVTYFPSDFNHAGEVLLASLSPAFDGDIFGITVNEKGIAGWAIMPMAHYVGVQGLAHFDLSMTLFKALTQRFSAEFGIRFFLLDCPEKTASAMKQWATDPNRHVRRLASEGIRPRLPWAMQLPAYIQNPEPVIELLEILKDDKTEYVRRSVANNLNDIAKDHPERVADIATQWMRGASKTREKLLRHACRTLIKQGHKKTLQVFGYKAPKLQQATIDIQTPKVMFGHALQFSLCLVSAGEKKQPLMIDYVIHHQKANGKTSPKVFKWCRKSLAAEAVGQSLNISKKHGIKKITTRVYYPGWHAVEVMVNGVSVAKVAFELLMP